MGGNPGSFNLWGCWPGTFHLVLKEARQQMQIDPVHPWLFVWGLGVGEVMQDARQRQKGGNERASRHWIRWRYPTPFSLIRSSSRPSPVPCPPRKRRNNTKMPNKAVHLGKGMNREPDTQWSGKNMPPPPTTYRRPRPSETVAVNGGPKDKLETGK